MSRLEELTFNLADEFLTDAEAVELQTLLGKSESARQTHIRLLQVEGCLRATGQSPDLAAAIMSSLHRSMADAIAQGVMKAIKEQPAPVRPGDPALEKRARKPVSSVLSLPLPTPWAAWSFSRAWLAVAVCVVLAVGLGVWWAFGPTMGEPTLAEVQGGALYVERAGKPLTVTPQMRLQVGDLLRTPQNVTVAISFAPEKTRITLNPDSELRLASSAGGKRFDLRLGKVEATVARQGPFRPMTLKTAQAEAKVLGTRFRILANATSTRLEVLEGKVRFTRVSDHAAVGVEGGEYAVAASGYELASQPLTGRILREYWTNLPGEYFITFLTSYPDFPDHPSGRDYLDKLEAPSRWGTNFGTRIRGYLHPPRSGNYEFWITASDGAELWLSADDRWENKLQIATGERSDRNEWNKSSNQHSGSIPLVAGKKYYIEVLQKQGHRADEYLAVAWQGPGRDREIIPGEFLSAFKPEEKK